MNHRIAKALTTVGIIAFIYSGRDGILHYSPSFLSNRAGMVQCQRALDHLSLLDKYIDSEGCIDYSARPAPSCSPDHQHTCGPIFNPGDAQ